MIGKIILIAILILVVLFVVVGIAGFIVLFMASSVIAILFHICGEDLEHQNSVNVPRGTTMGTTRTTNISRTGKK